VGDTYFQHKSFERIRQYRRAGTTLLLVSHDKQAIQSVCDRAILLDAGRLAPGAPEEIMDYYNALIAERENSTVRQRDDGKLQTISGTGEATVADIALLNETAKRSKWSTCAEVTLR
jgi:lipopolysaccharide transport system ATP-binding protein